MFKEPFLNKNTKLENEFSYKDNQEILYIQQITSDDKDNFSIISPQKTDSTGSDNWRSYLNRKKLLDAWCPPEGSPYKKFVKTKTMNSIEFVGSRIKPRYSNDEIKSVHEINNLINNEEFGQNTAIILDSGGPHSVAMAIKIVKHGYQPIVMLDSIPHTRSINNSSEQGLGVLLYYAEEMNKLKIEEKINPNAPPVFILDTHRNDIDSSFGKDKTKVINTYTHKKQDFPSAEDFQNFGIQKIVYLNEGDQKGKIRLDFQSIDRLAEDLKPIVQEWIRAGIKVVYTGINPKK